MYVITCDAIIACDKHMDLCDDKYSLDRLSP